MKLFRIFLFLLFALTVTNCSKDTVGNGDKIDKSANLKSSGDSANDFLSNNQHTDLLIQIAYVEGFQPAQKAIDDFIQFIKERTFKDRKSVV